MRRSILRTIVVLVGGHLVLGLALLSIEAIHGINDQDASFAVALLFHYLNLPTIWMLRSIGGSPGIGMVVVVGTVQWISLALVISIVFATARCAFLAITGCATKTAETETPGDA
jgi:hypothetical protein